MTHFPLQISTKIPQAELIQEGVRKKAKKLWTRYPQQITHIKVALDYEKKHLKHGKRYRVHVHVHVPGATLVDSTCDANVQIAVREAFRSVTRQIDERVHIRAGDIKAHSSLRRQKHSYFHDGDDALMGDMSQG